MHSSKLGYQDWLYAMYLRRHQFSNLVIQRLIADVAMRDETAELDITSEFFVEAQQLPSFFTEERVPLFIVDAEPEAIVGPKKKISVVTEI